MQHYDDLEKHQVIATFYDSPNDYRNYLCHYGVKGMHWGVRKADAYDNVYYRARYNNKKVQSFKDMKEGKISKGKHIGNRVKGMAGHYALDPFKIAGRDIGRSVRGWYRILTGKTFRKNNSQEYNPARDRAMGQIKNNSDKKEIDKLVQESLSNNKVVYNPSNGTYTSYADYDAIIDYLDSIALKDIEKLNKEN